MGYFPTSPPNCFHATLIPDAKIFCPYGIVTRLSGPAWASEAQQRAIETKAGKDFMCTSVSFR
jgi:hypothetical protein